MNAEIDAEELAEALSEKYLEEAKAGDLVQASEKLWGAACGEGGCRKV